MELYSSLSRTLKARWNIVAVAGCLAGAGLLRAQQIDVSLNAGILTNSTSSGAAPLADGSLVLLIADIGSSGPEDTAAFSTLVGGSNLNVGSLLDGHYQIIGTGTVDSTMPGGGPGDVFVDTGTITLGSGQFTALQTNQAVAAVWFPTLNGSSSTLPSDTAYGLFSTSSSAPLDGSSIWTIPSAGNSSSLLFLSDNNYGSAGSYDSSSGIFAANLTSESAVPEPSTFALIFGGAALAFAAWRKRTVQA